MPDVLYAQKFLVLLLLYLLDSGAIGIAELKQISVQKKQQIVTYEYRAIHRYANEDDCAGTIQFDFQNRTAKILTLADGDICNTNVFARTAIRYIWGLEKEKLPKTMMVPVKLMIADGLLYQNGS